MTVVIAHRKRLIDEVDAKPDDEDDMEELTKPDSDEIPKAGPSTEAMSRLRDYSK